jgi:O-antigen ligase
MSFPSIEKNNEYFLFGMIALLPVLGSGITVILAGVLIWALISLCFKRFPLKYDAKDIPLLLACGIYFAAQFLLTLYHAKKISDFEVFLPSIVALTPFLLLPRFRATPNLDYAKIVFRAAFLGCLAALLISLVQKFGLNMRAEGGAGNPLLFGAVVAFLGVTSLFGIKQKNVFSHPLLPVVGYLAGVVSIAVSGSRGPFLAIIISGVIFILFNSTSLQRQFKVFSLKKMAILGVMVLVAIVVVFKSPVGQRTHFEYNQLFMYQSALNSSQVRLAYFVEGAKLFREKPFLGHGSINRDATMFQASKIIVPKREPVEEYVVTSWHRLVPKPLRPILLNPPQKEPDIPSSQKTGENGSVPPSVNESKKFLTPTYEMALVKKGSHGHLHNEYLMYAVDGGIVGLISYISLVFGPAAFVFFASKQSRSQIMKAEIWTFISVMAILSAFNVAFENDIIAVTFMLILVALCLANNLNIRKSS